MHEQKRRTLAAAAEDDLGLARLDAKLLKAL
jgi:hypothetical protein